MIDFLVRLFFLLFFTITGIIWNVSYLSAARSMYKKFPEPNKKKRVSLLFPVYREKFESIMTTIRSILSQKYPRELLEIIFIVEPDDVQTQANVKKVIETLGNSGIRTIVVTTDGKKKLKAYALNHGLKYATGEIIGVLDADDDIPPDYISQVVSAVEHGYHCIGTRVYRLRKSLSSHLLHLELVLWYDEHLLVFWKIAGFHPLSGEGLFISRRALEDIGGFPEFLSEDCFTAFLAFVKGYRTCMIDTIILELAPKNFVSLAKQRIRWMRGTAQLFYYILRMKLPRNMKIKIEFAYFLPFFVSLGHIFAFLFLVDLFLIFIGIKSKFVLCILVSSSNELLTLLGSIMFCVYLPLTIIDNKLILSNIIRWRLNPLTLILLPFYLLTTSIIALYAFLTPYKIYWHKTERR